MPFYITTPIYYPNSKPHLGTAYTTMIADTFARFWENMGEDVFFLTGTDEHGEKLEQKATEFGKSPKEFVDDQSAQFKQIWSLLNIKYDRFIRTTDPDHIRVVRHILQKAYDNGDIYKDVYVGLYCVGCEAYYTEKDLVDGKCPYHNKEPEYRKLESYFFKWDKYEGWLRSLILENPHFLPYYRDEMLNFLDGGLEPISISRPKSQTSWGVELPFDSNHVAYVWYDALTNYLTGIGYLDNPKTFKKFWPAIHVVGKDINRFHSLLWPAMLKSVGVEPPKTVLVHGFITVNGQKMSKSLGNVVDPIEVSQKYGSDSLRFYLVAKLPFGRDMDFSVDEFKRVYNANLAGDYGNLVNRCAVLLNKVGVSDFKPDKALETKIDSMVQPIKSHVEDYDLKRAIDLIWSLVQHLNKVLSDSEPWKLPKDEARPVVLNTAEGLIFAISLLWPFLPESAERVGNLFGGFKKFHELKPFGQNILASNSALDRLILFKKIV